MKKTIWVLVFSLLLVFGINAKPARADVAVQAGIAVGTPAYEFYGALSPYGGWVYLNAHGWVWYPYDISVDWRPYSNGYWIYTEYGWTWVSNEPWGWATFHYGRWVYDSSYGWVWCPGDVWGPAWVVWRTGPGYIGWAPLPPAVEWRIWFGFSNAYDWNALVPSFGYCFVRDRDFVNRDVGRYIRFSAGNVTLLKETRVHLLYRSYFGRVVNELYGQRTLESKVWRRLPRYRVANVSSPRDISVRGNEFRLFRPDLRTTTGKREMRNFRAPQQSGGVRMQRQTPQQEKQDLGRLQESRRTLFQQNNRQEMQHPPQGVSRQELQQRQAREYKALQQQDTREQQLLKKQQQREQQRPSGNRSRQNAPSYGQHYFFGSQAAPAAGGRQQQNKGGSGSRYTPGSASGGGQNRGGGKVQQGGGNRNGNNRQDRNR